MKKWIITVCVLAVLLMMTGCGKASFKPSITSIYVQKDGKITQAIVESFEKEYYSLAEFQSMIGMEVEKYNSSYGEERISIERLDVDSNNTLYLLLDFADADTYEHYNETFCFEGTISEALDEGLSFNMDFKDADYEEYTTSQVTEKKDQSVVVLKQEGIVQTEKQIKYVSNNVEILSEHMVEVMPIEDDNEYAYIIY